MYVVYSKESLHHQTHNTSLKYNLVESLRNLLHHLDCQVDLWIIVTSVNQLNSTIVVHASLKGDTRFISFTTKLCTVFLNNNGVTVKVVSTVEITNFTLCDHFTFDVSTLGTTEVITTDNHTNFCKIFILQHNFLSLNSIRVV